MSSTYFDQLQRQWPEVNINERGVMTNEFLEAAEGLVKLFDLLGSAAFSVVQKDMTGNIAKVRNRLLSHPAQSETLEELVKNECATEKKRTATEGLLWLLRGLQFTAVALRRSVQNATEELVDSFTKAYEATLRPFHGMLVRPLFSLAMKATPYRKDFYAKLGSDQAKVKEQLDKNSQALEGIVTQVQTFYAQGNYAKGL
ncbi:hypothetical protein PYCC9005_002420 [Savitreella phatthalungensis]